MCGISGIYKISKKASLENVDFHFLNTRLHHRGPDAHGILTQEDIIMGHRRLAITDLSSVADQPMISNCGRYRIVFNGEIYNYLELKKEIPKVKPQLNFNSSSDTEVILESFAIWGARAVYKWNGMFSIAIWDNEDGTLWLFRDRMGEKPLYYYYDEEYFCFASELKFIEALPFFKRDIDQKSVTDFLHLGLIPDPYTIYRNVYKLRSGHYMHISSDEIVEKAYWEIQDSLSPDCIEDEKEAVDTLEELLLDSVRLRLSKNLTNGIFLSGGIDSSMVAAMASACQRNNVISFSLGFDDVRHNENRHAEKVASYLGLQHHSVHVTAKEAAQEFQNLSNVFDEPFADSSAIAVLLLSKHARKHVKVILSGEGSDELFFGYGRYRWARYLSNPLVWNSRHFLSRILQSGNDRYKKAAGVFDVERENIYNHTLSHDHNLFSLKELQQNLITYHSPKYFQDKIELRRKLTLAEQQSLFELGFYLKDDLLVKLDRSAMYYSLEARCPFLDEKLVAFALNISPSLKIKNETQKYVLKKVLYKYLPSKYFERPKQGFSVPLPQWLKNDFKCLVDEYLDESVIKKAGWFQPQYITQLKNAFLNGQDHLANRLWALLLLHKWFHQKILSGTASASSVSACE